jgi:hypothetical protein
MLSTLRQLDLEENTPELADFLADYLLDQEVESMLPGYGHLIEA